MSIVAWPVEKLQAMPRPPEYMAEIRAAMLEEKAGLIFVDLADPRIRALKAKYADPRYRAAKVEWQRIAAESIAANPPPPAHQPLPRNRWPMFARAVSKLASAEDAGLGDTIHRHLARFGADAMKRLYRRVVGKDCGCGDRQAKLNQLFPYDPPRT